MTGTTSCVYGLFWAGAAGRWQCAVVPSHTRFVTAAGEVLTQRGLLLGTQAGTPPPGAIQQVILAARVWARREVRELVLHLGRHAIGNTGHQSRFILCCATAHAFAPVEDGLRP